LSELYRIFETDIFLEDFEKTPKSIQEKLRMKISSFIYPTLKSQPYFGKNIKKLTGFSLPTWRYRLGDFRIFYTIDEIEKVILILTIVNKKDAY
jgi:mRNA interferase RelE/StbE